MDERTKLKAKIDSNAVLSTAMRHKVSDHMFINLSSEVMLAIFLF
jgi:hypothetical protein